MPVIQCEWEGGAECFYLSKIAGWVSKEGKANTFGFAFGKSKSGAMQKKKKKK